MALDGEDDRRASPRIRLQRRVSVTLRGTPYDTHTINVSTGGASVELITAPERGARGTIVLALSAGPPIDLSVEVRWASALSTSGPAGPDTRHLVGLQFLEVPPDAARRIEDALAAEDED
jgi:hypothetical protein